MFRRFGYALAFLTLAALMAIPSATHGGEHVGDPIFPSSKSGWAEKLGGKWYGSPYNVVLPDPIVIEEPAADVPKECTRWLGVWADAKWGTKPGVLIVHSVSFMSDGWCRARVTNSTGVSSSRPLNTLQDKGYRNVPRIRPDLPAIIYNGELSITPKLSRNEWQVSFKMSTNGNTLRGNAFSALTDGRAYLEARFKRMQLP